MSDSTAENEEGDFLSNTETQSQNEEMETLYIEKILDLEDIYRNIKKQNNVKHRPGFEKPLQMFDNYVSTCRDLFVNNFDILGQSFDKLNVCPEFCKTKLGYKITNLVSLWSDFIKCKKEKFESLGIAITKVSSYTSIEELYSKICRRLINSQKLTKQDLQQIIMWYSIYLPKQIYPLAKDLGIEVDFWHIVLEYYCICTLRQTDIHSKIRSLKEPDELDDEPCCDDAIVDKFIRCTGSFTYIACIGVYFIKDMYKIIYKIGKSNPENSTPYSRFKKHAVDKEYLDFHLLAVNICANESAMELLIKEKLKQCHMVAWQRKELYAIHYNMYVDLTVSLDTYMSHQFGRKKHIQTIIKMKASDDKIQKLEIEQNRLIGQVQEKDVLLQEKIEEIDLITSIHQEEIKDKDKEIEALKNLLAKQLIETNKLRKLIT